MLAKNYRKQRCEADTKRKAQICKNKEDKNVRVYIEHHIDRLLAYACCVVVILPVWHLALSKTHQRANHWLHWWTVWVMSLYERRGETGGGEMFVTWVERATVMYSMCAWVSAQRRTLVSCGLTIDQFASFEFVSGRKNWNFVCLHWLWNFGLNYFWNIPQGF